MECDVRSLQIILILVAMSIVACTNNSNIISPENNSGNDEKSIIKLSSTTEFRATWVHASSIASTKALRKEFINDILNAGLNTIFVMTPKHKGNFGYGSYRSFYLFAREAKANGLSVHIWIPNGQRLGRTIEIDFTKISEQDAQVDWIRGLLKSGAGQFLAGVHLDYIRFAHSEDVNIAGKMDAVNNTVRKISEMIDSEFPDIILTAAVFKELPNREERTNGGDPVWKEDVPQWYRDWFVANGNNSIYKDSRYVYVPMCFKYQQDPITWIKNNWVDAIIPMQYSTLDSKWEQTADYYASFANFVNAQEKLYMGLGWTRKTSANSTKGYDPAGVVRKIKSGRSKGINGYAIFLLGKDYANDDDIIEALTIDSPVNNDDAPFK
jgi:uncharacterized lipoprotein YddW (UPF0748 family)